MTKTVEQIYSRLQVVSLALWALKSLNAALIIISISTLSILAMCWGVVEGWRGEQILQLFTGLGVLTTLSPISLSIYWLFKFLRRPWISRYIEQRDPELNDALLTVLSAERDPHLGDTQVIEALSEHVQLHLDETPIKHWVSLRIIRTGAIAFGFMGSLCFGSFYTYGDQLHSVFDLLTESPERLTQKLAYTPLIGDIKLTITPPKYTGHPPRFLEGSSGDFEALEGSEVLIEATLSRQASSAQLWIEGNVLTHLETTQEGGETQAVINQQDSDIIKNSSHAVIPLSIQRRLVTAQVRVNSHFKWNVSLIDREGIEWREAAQRRVVATLDRPPSVKITRPVTGERVDPSKDLKVKIDAKDDYGLGGASLFVALASDMKSAEVLPLNGVKGRRWNDEDLVDLRVIQAQGGDRIALWAEATDRRSEPLGIQKSTSEVIYLEVDSPEWAHRKLLDQLREHLEVQVDCLASRLEIAYLSSNEPPLKLQDLLMRWVNARQKSVRAQESLDHIIQQLAEDELTPKEIYLTFTNHLFKLEQALSDEGQQMNGQLAEESSSQAKQAPSLIGTQKIKQVEAKSAPVELAHEGIIIIIEAMVARMALEEMSKLADELKVSRAHIKDLMQMYKAQPSESLKSRIMRELQRFKQKMKAMRDMMDKLQKKLPAEFLNLDGMKTDEVADSLKESESQVSSIEQLMAKGNIEEAMKALDELSNALEEMSQQLQEDMEELHRQTNPELEKALSELMDSTRDLMKAQDELKQDTQSQQGAIDQEMESALEQNEEAFQVLKKKVERIQGIEKNLKLSRNGRYIERVRADARKSASDLKRAMDQLMLDEGIDAAERGESEFLSLQRLNQNFDYGRRNQKSQSPSQKQLKEAKRLSGEVAEELKEIKLELEERSKHAQEQEAQAQEARRKAKERQAQSEAQQAQAGQPQSAQNGQPQSAQNGQPQSAQNGQPQSAQNGQPQSTQNGQPQSAQNGQPQSSSPRNGLARRQSEISQRLEKLRSRLAQRREKIPSLNQVPTEPFDQAQQGSNQAARQLQQAQPGRGLGGQKQVSDALKQVMEGLQQAKKPQQGQKPGGEGKKPNGQRQQGSKGRSSTERVEVPEQTERGPQSMRKELLDAMKSKPARGYDDQVKAYYDSLVR